MKRYTLKTLPGDFSGRPLLCTMFVAFKTVAPGADTGFDVSRESETAVTLHTTRKGKLEAELARRGVVGPEAQVRSVGR